MTGRPTLLDRTLANIASETLLPMVRPGAPPNVHGGASREGAAPRNGATSLRIASAQSVPVGFKPAPSLRSARASVSAYTGPRRPTHHLSIVEGAALMRDVDEALQRVRGERVASTGCGLEALGHATVRFGLIEATSNAGVAAVPPVGAGCCASSGAASRLAATTARRPALIWSRRRQRGVPAAARPRQACRPCPSTPPPCSGRA